jgi:hypothetical protein
MCLFLGAALSASAAAETIVKIRAEVVGADSMPVAVASLGDELMLKVMASDQRPAAEGIFSLFTNVTYDASVLEPIGQLQIGPEFESLAIGDIDTPGLVHRAGGITGFSGTGANEILVFSLPLEVIGTGTVEIRPAMSTDDDDEILVFGMDNGLVQDQLLFQPAVLAVVPEPSGMALAFLAPMALRVRKRRR